MKEHATNTKTAAVLARLGTAQRLYKFIEYKHSYNKEKAGGASPLKNGSTMGSQQQLHQLLLLKTNKNYNQAPLHHSSAAYLQP